MRFAVMTLAALVVLMVMNSDVCVTAALGDGGLRDHGDPRDSRYLATNKFEKLKVQYDPTATKDKKCWLKYTIKDKEEVKVQFKDSEIKEKDSGKTVICVKEKQSPEQGLKLPIDLDIDEDAEWIGQAVNDADVRWDESKKPNLYIQIKRIYGWKASYDPKGSPKCKLEYQYKKDSPTKVKFKDSEVSQNGNLVYCERDNYNAFPSHLDETKVDIDKQTTWKNEKVNDGRVTWNRDYRNLRLRIIKKEDQPDCDDPLENEYCRQAAYVFKTEYSDRPKNGDYVDTYTWSCKKGYVPFSWAIGTDEKKCKRDKICACKRDGRKLTCDVRIAKESDSCTYDIVDVAAHIICCKK